MYKKIKSKRSILYTLLTLIALLFVIALTACGDSDNHNTQSEDYLVEIASVVKNDYYDYHFYNSVEELEDSSDYIVKVKGIGERELVTWKDKYDPTDPGVSGTQTTVKITEVFKGSLHKNDTIIVHEPAYFEDQKYYSSQGYNLMVTDSEYLLFLRQFGEQFDDGAVIIGMYQGKYDLNNSSEVKFVSGQNEYQQIKDVEYFGDQQEVDHFNMLKKQVLDKYK